MGNLASYETLSNLLMILLFPEFQTGVVLASDKDFAASPLLPLAAQHNTNNIVAMAMEFEAEHRECVRVLTYRDDDHVKVKFYVFSGKSGIPETLKAAAQDCFKDFKEMDVKLEWLDLYRDVDKILNIRPLEYPSGTRQVLNASKANEINKIISENLHVLVRHHNITAVQPSLKITNSEQTGIPCITFYVLCKGVIPDGECLFPRTLGSYPVDVVDGIWFRTDDPWTPNEAQEPNEVLCLGASIGVQGEDAAGTLGAIVTDSKTSYYVLSCDHVMRHDTKSEIIHPTQNDYLNYLNYNLEKYGERIQFVINKDICYTQPGQFSFENIAELEGLSKRFKELQKIRETHQDERATTRNKNKVYKCEEALQKGLELQPRVIAKYSVGISGNVTWNDGQRYYVDAALAELTPEEIDRLKQNKHVELNERVCRLSGEYSSGLTLKGDLCKSGRTTGFTQTECRKEPSMCLSASLYEVNAQNKSLVSVMKSVRLCQNCKKRSGIGEQLESTVVDCASCKKDTATLCDSLWLKNCLCIDHLSRRGCASAFATDGDSGAVLFEKDDAKNLRAFGIIFGVHLNAYKHYTLATPMKIALESLSKRFPEKTDLSLLSKFSE